MNIPLEPQEQMSVGTRIIGVFNNPRTAFADIGDQPRWLPPLLIITAINLLSTVASIPKIKEFSLYTLEQQAQAAPDLAVGAAADMVVNAAIVGAVLVGLFSPVFICLLYAGLLKLFNLFAGEPTQFRKFFAVTVYSYFPLLIATVIATGLILVSPATHLEEVSTSLYLLFPPGSKGFAASLARQIDPFFLWSLVLMALGGSIISKTRFRSYVIYVLGIWVFFALGSALLAQGV